MGKKRIADLSATLTADTTAYEQAMNRAAASTKGMEGRIAVSFGSIAKEGLKFGLILTGVHDTAKGIAHEIHSVVDGIDAIPGVSSETVDSIKQFQGIIAESKHAIDRLTAAMISGAIDSAGAIRKEIDVLIYGKEKAEEFAKARASNALEAVKNTPENIKKEADATKALAAAREELSLVGEKEWAKINRLRKSAGEQEAGVASLPDNDLGKINALTEATKTRTEAETDYLKLKEQEKKVAEEAGQALGPLYGSSLTARESVKGLTAEVTRLEQELAALPTDGDPQLLDLRIQKWQQLKTAAEQLQKSQDKVDKTAVELGMTFSSAFEDAIVTGSKLSDVLRSLAQDVTRIFLRETVTTPMASGLSGFFKDLFKADGGPVTGGSPYIVGEQGPELFVPGASGSIVPNHALGMGGGGDVYNFAWHFPTGVTRQEFAGMLPKIIEMTTAAVADKVQRGGQYKRAFG